MQSRSLLFLLWSLLLLSIGSLTVFLFNIDPFSTHLAGKIAFYATFFIFFSSLTTLAGFYFRVGLSNREIVFRVLPLALRQGGFFGIAVSLIAFLQSLRILSWWDIGLLFAILLLIELYIQARFFSKML